MWAVGRRPVRHGVYGRGCRARWFKEQRNADLLNADAWRIQDLTIARLMIVPTPDDLSVALIRFYRTCAEAEKRGIGDPHLIGRGETPPAPGIGFASVVLAGFC